MNVVVICKKKKNISCLLKKEEQKNICWIISEYTLGVDLRMKMLLVLTIWAWKKLLRLVSFTQYERVLHLFFFFTPLVPLATKSARTTLTNLVSTWSILRRIKSMCLAFDVLNYYGTNNTQCRNDSFKQFYIFPTRKSHESIICPQAFDAQRQKNIQEKRMNVKLHSLNQLPQRCDWCVWSPKTKMNIDWEEANLMKEGKKISHRILLITKKKKNLNTMAFWRGKWFLENLKRRHRSWCSFFALQLLLKSPLYVYSSVKDFHAHINVHRNLNKSIKN